MYAATGSMISFEKMHSLLVSTVGEFDTGGVRASVSGFRLVRRMDLDALFDLAL